MNLQENINRIKEVMGLLSEDVIESYLDFGLGKNNNKPELKPELQKFKKQFQHRPTSESITSEIKFEIDGETNNLKRWRIILPDNFMGKDSDTDQYTLVDKDGSPIEGLKVPLNTVLESSMYIYTEGKYNRIHFTQMGLEFEHRSGIPPELRGVGLGYLIYEEFIHFLGFASSAKATPEAMNIWKKLHSDPEFYGVLISYDNSDGNILLFHKSFNGNVEDITTGFIRGNLGKILHSENTENLIEIDDRLMKYPKVVNIYNDIIKMRQMNYSDKMDYRNRNYPL